MENSKYKLVKVKWQDIVSNSNWKTLEEAHEWAEKEMGVCYSVGWLIEKNKDYILVAGTYDQDSEEYNDISKIPVPNVYKITKL